MKLKIGLFAIFLLSAEMVFAQKNISCANRSCSTNFAPLSVYDRDKYSVIDVGENHEDINVTAPFEAEPHSLRMSVTNGYPGRELNVNLSATRPVDNAGDIVIIGDLFSNLTIRTNGYNGSRGKDASELCAERFRSGQYGTDSKNFFEQRRQSDPSLSLGRCNREDLNYLQSFKFTCQDPTDTLFTGENPEVEVLTMNEKLQCSGVMVQDLCIKKRVTVGCSWLWRYWRASCNWKNQCSAVQTDINHWTYTSQRFDLLYYNALMNNVGGNLNSFCQHYVQKPAPLGPQTNFGTYHFSSVGWYAHSSSVTENTGTQRYKYLLNRDLGATMNSVPNGTPNPPGYETYLTSLANDFDLTLNHHSVACGGNYSKLDSLLRQKIVTSNTNSCARADLSVIEDPLGRVNFAFVGYTKSPDFGFSKIRCSPNGCSVNSSVSEFNKSIEEIIPENGSSGTKQGFGQAFVYDIDSLNTSAIPGVAGAGGKNDLPVLSSYRYCVKVFDKQTMGQNSEYARNPQVVFKKYNWNALKSASGGNSGNPPASSDKGISIFRKIDDSVRYFLGKELPHYQ